MKQLENIPFEVHGFYEEYIDAESYSFYGIRTINKEHINERQLGYSGKQTVSLLGTYTFDNGYKKSVVIFKKPTKIITMIHAVCGKIKT